MLGKFSKFTSLLSFRGHSISREGARLLAGVAKPRRLKPQTWLIANECEQLECRQLLAADVNISQLPGTQNSVSLAVNPTNPLNLVTLSDGGAGNSEFIAFTTDGGKTWTQSPLTDSDDGIGGVNSDRFDGAVTFDSFGNCHITYIARSLITNKTAVIYGLSTDGGQSFVTEILENPGVPSSSGNSDKPWITTGPDAINSTLDDVVVTYRDNNGNLVATAATISGLGQITTFSNKTAYSPLSSGNYGVPAIGPQGQVAVTWQTPSSGQSGGSIRFAIDANGLQGGLNFGSTSVITQTNVGGVDFIPASPFEGIFASPYLAYDLSQGPHRGRLYCAYANETIDESNNTDVYVKYSDDDGKTWSVGVKVNDDSGSNSQFFQNIAVDPVTGGLFIGWYDARNDKGGFVGTDTDGSPNTDVEYWGSQSSDGGLTWSQNVKISDGASNVFRNFSSFTDFGRYTGVAFYNGVGYAAWADNSDSTNDNPDHTANRDAFDIYFDSVLLNLPPTIALTAPGTVTVNENSVSIPVNFVVGDDTTLPTDLIVTATSSNQALIKNSAIVLSGSGANRTVSFTPTLDHSGPDTITLTVSDGSLSTSVTFNVDVLPVPVPLPTPGGTTLTTTPFVSSTTPVPLPDNSVTTDTITVSGLDPFLYDADVTINIDHPSNGQLSVVLISPQGTRVTLTSGNGGNLSNVFAGTTFDDQLITAPVTDYNFQDTVAAPYLVPEGALAQLRLEDPNGNWTLEVTNLAVGANAVLNSWGLSLTTLPAAPKLQTFSDSTAAIPVPIPDTGVPVLLPLSFNGLDPFTWDVNLHVNISHTNNADLDISLISPSGTEILMSSGNGGTNDNVFKNATFDDQGIDPMSSMGIPVTDAQYANNQSVGIVIPEAALSGFLGENPNGIWYLKVVDHNTNQQTGSVIDYGLDITTIFFNDPPTLGSIANPGSIQEDSGPVTIGLNSISAGGGESQLLAVTATSSDPSIIPNPVVNYTSPLNSGTLTFTPVPNAFGVVTITVRVEDGGYDQDLSTTGDNAFTTKEFVVVVNPVNDPPTLDPIANLGTVNEDFGEILVPLTGITAGGGETQKLQVTAVSSQPDVIGNPVIEYTPGQTTGTLHLESNPDFNGSVTISVQVMDAGFDNDLLTTADNLITTRQFTVFVAPVNDPPTIDPIPDPAPINEDAPPQQVLLTNITPGGREVQELRVTATSSNLSVISDVFVNYQPGSSTANLILRPGANGYGTSTITVTVTDGGLDGLLSTTGDNLSTTETFTETINQVNDPPVFNTLGDVLVLDEDALHQQINISGISAGPLENQDMVFSVSSSDPSLIPNPVVAYTSPGTDGTLDFDVVGNKSGSSIITLTLMDAGLDGDLLTLDDNQQFTRTLTVIVRPVNDLPTIDDIPDLSDLIEGAGKQTISLSGITAGANEVQPLKVEAFSSNPALIPSPLINYTSDQSDGTLSFTPAPDAFGEVTISVRVTDGGLDGNLSTTADNGITTKEFKVTLAAVNDPPSFDPIADPTPVDESQFPTSQQIVITNISSGPGETDALTFSVSTGISGVITNPALVYVPGSTTATLTFAPLPGQFGNVPVTVTVTDAGGLTYSQTFHVRVNPFNNPPTMDDIPDPAAVDEDSGPQTVPLTNVSAGPANESLQPLKITAVSSNPNLITSIVANTNAGIPNSLTYTFGANVSGTAVITVTLTDGGLDNDLSLTADNKSIVKQFTVTVNSVNDPPSLSIFDSNSQLLSGNYNINEDSGIKHLSLQNISAGPLESQPLKVTATVAGTGLNLISPPIVTYSSPDATGTLTFTPLANKSGTAIINVRVEDGGADNDLSTTFDNLVTTYDLNVNIAEVNDSPTLDPIADAPEINEGAGTQLVTLAGITAGGGEQQSLLVTATSDRPGLIPNPSIVYADGSTTGELFFTPVPHQSGTAHVTVTVNDQHGGIVTRTFTVTVDPLNDPPTIDDLGPALTIDQDSNPITINLTGISGGIGESSQLIKVTATSSRPGTIADPILVYTPQSPTGTITFQPLPGQTGTAVLSVKVMDGGADGNLNTLQDNLTTIVTLTVNVMPVSTPPSVTIDGGTAASKNGHPVSIAPNAAIQDPDTTNFRTGGILVSLTDGAQPGDRLILKKFGSGSDRIGATKSGLLKRGHSVIGSVTGGANGVPLVISFSGNVTRKEVQSILRNVQFAGNSKNLGLRNAEIVVTDDKGNQSDPVDRSIALN
jgi:subtilisin-like proprotein convertase family protein